MTEPTRDYFARRADEERRAAEQAPDERAADSHRKLAAQYESLATGEREPPSDGPRPAESPIVSSDFRILP
jgi:hypothetical protein